MSLSTKIFIGLFLGIFTGLFLGEKAMFLQYGEEAFVLLLQMTILPYIVVSLISGLGNLSLERSKMLAKNAGIAMVLIWGISIAVVLLTVVLYPEVVNATFFSTSMVQTPEPFNIVSLYIPANPFNALATNIVPAAVLFSIAVGLAVMTIPEKKPFIDMLNVIQTALGKVTKSIVSLTPYGIFAIAGRTAGTMDFAELKQLQLFIIVYVTVSLLMTYVILPLLVTSFTNLSYRKVVFETKDMMLTAFMTGNLMVILPLLSDHIKNCLHEQLTVEGDSDDTVDVIVSSSFNFPNAGKLMLLLFIVFAAWYSGSPLEFGELPVLGSLGLVTLFGSSNVAFPFLFDILRIPQDMFQLFISLSVITARFATLLASMHILVLGLLGSFAIAGLMQFKKRAFIKYVSVTGGVLIVSFLAMKLLFTNPVFHEEYNKDDLLVEMKSQSHHQAELWGSRPIPIVDESMPIIDQIKERGVLRVGYLAEALPYAYRNEKGEAIGLDIDMAHQLAYELGVKLKITKFPRGTALEALNTNDIDIVMSGLPITTDIAQYLAYTVPYLEEVMAFVTPDHLLKKYEEIDPKINSKVMVRDQAYFTKQLDYYLPNVDVVPVNSMRKFFKDTTGEYEALFMTAERGAAWSLLYPDFTVAIPKKGKSQLPLAYAIRSGNEEFIGFMNSWITLKRNDGTVQRFYDYWILGENAEPRKPRWSIMRNVLHWGEKKKEAKSE